ncbi:MAG: RluA family pseudouridine synthase [Clostridia bacterium]
MSVFDRFQAGPDDHGRRVDRIIRRLYPGLPLSLLYRMFRTGSVRLSGKKAKGADLVHSGDEILVKHAQGMSSVHGAADDEALPKPDQVRKAYQLFESLILISTPDLIFINKPKGLLTHGPEGIDELTTAYYSDKPSVSLSFRPAPLHRLDRNTSGVLVISASIVGAQAFSAAMKSGAIGKIYLALLDGRLEKELHMKDRLVRNRVDRTSAVVVSDAGALAETWLTPVIVGARHTLVAVRISTGLTHQIRVQCASHGFPLSGDRKYAGSSLRGGYLLHCAELSFPPTIGVEAPMMVTAPLPQAFKMTLESIFDPASLDSKALRRYF